MFKKRKRIEKRMDRDPRKKRRKVCIFCQDKIAPDYKKADLVRRFVTERGKIATQRSSGCCAKHQRALAREIKKARHIGFVAFAAE